MKKQLLGLVALFSCVALVACGPKEPTESKPAVTSSGKHEHTFDETKWEYDANQHWHPATCEHTTAKGSAAKHDWEKVEAESVPATHTTAGKLVQVCKVCGYKSETTIEAQPTTWVADGAKDGVVQKEKCATCDDVAYYLSVADAEGWNDPATKWNAKDSPKDTATWDITGKIAAGKYAIALDGHMSYDSHGENYFGNHAISHPDQLQASAPDSEEEDPFRYYFKLDGGEAINPIDTKTWAELGYAGGTGAENAAPIVVDEITIGANAKTFQAFHGHIGYSMIVAGVRLIKLA